MTPTANERRHRGLSGLLHRLAAVTAGERVGAVMAAAIGGWLIVYALTGFPEWMATALEVAAAAITIVMLFVIQHTQRRLETATQLKLDELVRVTDADDRVARIETDQDELDRQMSRAEAQLR